MSTAPTNLTDPEREHFVRRIRDLERRLRRWRLACVVLLALLLLPVVLGGLFGAWWVPRLERERAYRRALEAADRVLEEQVDVQRDRLQIPEETQELLQEYERQRALAEEGDPGRAQQGSGEGKD